MQALKFNKVLLICVMLLGLILSWLYPAYIAPKFAVKDPNDPRFRVENFRFYNYPASVSDPDYQSAVRRMFPMGTARQDVEKILVKAAGAEVQVENEYNASTVYYLKLGRFPTAGYHWIIKIKFDAEDRLVSIELL